MVRVPVGRQAAIDALSSYRPEQVALAGEGTGAVMMPRFRFVYDGIASMLAVLSMMRERGQQAERDPRRGYPRYSHPQRPGAAGDAAHAGAADGAAGANTRTAA